MKKRKFSEGGYTDQEASDLMLKDIVPKRESIRLTSDEPATPQSAADTAAEEAAMAREMAREARAAAPRPAAPRAAPAPRPAATPAPSRSNQNDYSMNDAEGSGRGTSTRAPSRGSYDMDGPVAGLLKMAAEPKGKVTPRPRMIPSADEGPRMTSRKPKPMSRAEKAERDAMNASPFKKGGSVGASKRGDGIAQRGKTKGRML
jgi:hypothetical protein